ncbi:MAG: SDR family oxidoreductase [Bdellovibrio sp.]
MDLQLKNRRVLVLGASQGIGQAIAESFCQEGARVAISSRSEEILQRSAHEMGAEAWKCIDLSKAHSGAEVASWALEALGGVDVFVYNTGGPRKGDFLQISNPQWHEDFQSLWMSLVEALQVLLPRMRQQKFGRVLAVTSLAAKEPLKSLTTSNAFRAGLPGLFRSISNEFAVDDITLNLLLPGHTDTQRLRQLHLSPEQVAQIIPRQKLVQPKEFGSLACYLASVHAASITGQSFVVDGGAQRSHS